MSSEHHKSDEAKVQSVVDALYLDEGESPTETTRSARTALASSVALGFGTMTLVVIGMLASFGPFATGLYFAWGQTPWWRFIIIFALSAFVAEIAIFVTFGVLMLLVAMIAER